MQSNWPRNTVTVLNIAFGALFAYVAMGPISELISSQHSFGWHLTFEAAVVFVASAVAFFIGAWALLKRWPRMWTWQILPAMAATGMVLLLT